jgi:outer membrane protein assembly factor BamB
LTGGLLWSADHNGLQDFDEPHALSVSPDGGTVFVTGTSSPTVYYDHWGYPWPDLDFGTLAYDAATGAQLWTTYYHGGPGYPAEEAHDIEVDPKGRRVFVTGRAEGATSFDFLTVGYDAALGTELWTARFDAAGDKHDRPIDLAVGPGGTRVFVTGLSGSISSQDDDFVTLAYDAVTGTELWRVVRSTPTDDEPRGVAVTPDGGRVVVTGSTRDTAVGQPGADLLALVYDAVTGAQLGEARFRGPTSKFIDDRASAIAADPLGRRAFVVGQSAEPGGADLDAFALAYRIPYLAADVDAISLSKGGHQALSLVADADHAGLAYLVLGTLGATTPGIPVDGVVLPLTIDAYLLYSLEKANQPPFGSTLGLLDGSGLAAASFDVPLGSSLSHAGSRTRKQCGRRPLAARRASRGPLPTGVAAHRATARPVPRRAFANASPRSNPRRRPAGCRRRPRDRPDERAHPRPHACRPRR